MPKLKGIKSKTMWAVFAPDGYLQVRSISDTKSQCIENLLCNEISTVQTRWEDYAILGFVINKIKIDVQLL